MFSSISVYTSGDLERISAKIALFNTEKLIFRVRKSALNNADAELIHSETELFSTDQRWKFQF